MAYKLAYVPRIWIYTKRYGGKKGGKWQLVKRKAGRNSSAGKWLLFRRKTPGVALAISLACMHINMKNIQKMSNGNKFPSQTA